MTLLLGEMVFLQTEDLPLGYANASKVSRKLQHHFGGPYRIQWVRGTAVKLEFSPDLPIHDLFHVSRLRHDTFDHMRTQVLPPPLRTPRGQAPGLRNVEGIYEVRGILDHAMTAINSANM
jgi:hypothetical protein